MTEHKKKPPAVEGGKKTSMYLVYGEDEYMVSAKARSLVDRVCPPADQAFGLEIVEGRAGTVAEAVSAVVRCREALQTVGFLAGSKTVWLRDANFFSDTVVGKSAEVKEKIAFLTADLKAGLAPGQILVISAGKVDGRSAFFKACKECGELTEYAVSEKTYQAEEQAGERAREMFTRAGLTIGSELLHAFITKVGIDTRQIVQEVEKLSVYMGARKQVSEADLNAVVSASHEAAVWDLADAVGNRDLTGAVRVLRQLLFQGENTVGLIFGLEGRFRELLLYRECMDRRWARLAGQAPWFKVEWSSGPETDALLSVMGKKDPRQANPYRAGRLADQARKFSLRELVRCHSLTLAAHEQLVSSAVPSDITFEILLVKLLGNKPKAALYSAAEKNA